MENYRLIDNAGEKRYEFHIGDMLAGIDYIKTRNGEIYLTHTEVPEELEGRGVGSELVEKALQDIDRQNLKLFPQCPFVAAYVRKHPQWKRLLVEYL